MATRERTSLAGEWRTAGEWARLLADPIYYGAGVPRGDGRLVLLLPGLFGSDLYLQPLHTWLRRVGYRPVRSTLLLNAGCYERLSRQAEAELQRWLRRQPGPLALIGHSRGGVLARAIASRLQDRASHLILLGSPVGALLSSTPHEPGSEPPAPTARVVVEASARARRFLDPTCNFPDCGCPFPRDLHRPLHPRTRVVSFYSRDDTVVPPTASRLPGARNVEVRGTHSGLVYNHAVYQGIAVNLSERD